MVVRRRATVAPDGAPFGVGSEACSRPAAVATATATLDGERARWSSAARRAAARRQRPQSRRSQRGCCSGPGGTALRWRRLSTTSRAPLTSAWRSSGPRRSSPSSPAEARSPRASRSPSGAGSWGVARRYRAPSQAPRRSILAPLRRGEPPGGERGLAAGRHARPSPGARPPPGPGAGRRPRRPPSRPPPCGGAPTTSRPRGQGQGRDGLAHRLAHHRRREADLVPGRPGEGHGLPRLRPGVEGQHRLPPAVAVVGQEVLQLQLRPGEGHPRIARGRAGQAHRLRPARLRAQAEDNRQVPGPAAPAGVGGQLRLPGGVGRRPAQHLPRGARARPAPGGPRQAGQTQAARELVEPPGHPFPCPQLSGGEPAYQDAPGLGVVGHERPAPAGAGCAGAPPPRSGPGRPGCAPPPAAPRRSGGRRS